MTTHSISRRSAVSAFFALRRGRALLGATGVLLVLVLPAMAGAMPAPDHTTVAVPTAPTAPTAPSAIPASHARQQYYTSYGHPTPLARPVAATTTSPSRPSWLGFALAAGGALLLGAIGGCTA